MVMERYGARVEVGRGALVPVVLTWVVVRIALVVDRRAGLVARLGDRGVERQRFEVMVRRRESRETDAAHHGEDGGPDGSNWRGPACKPPHTTEVTAVESNHETDRTRKGHDASECRDELEIRAMPEEAWKRVVAERQAE